MYASGVNAAMMLALCTEAGGIARLAVADRPSRQTLDVELDGPITRRNTFASVGGIHVLAIQ
jgi:hypothetical protein